MKGSVFVLILFSSLWLKHSLVRLAFEPYGVRISFVGFWLWFDQLSWSVSAEKRLGHAVSFPIFAMHLMTWQLCSPPCLEQTFIDKKVEARAESLLRHVLWFGSVNDSACSSTANLPRVMYICIHAFMYICIYVYLYICTYVYMYICIHVNMYICKYVYM